MTLFLNLGIVLEFTSKCILVRATRVDRRERERQTSRGTRTHAARGCTAGNAGQDGWMDALLCSAVPPGRRAAARRYGEVGVRSGVTGLEAKLVCSVGRPVD